MFVLTRNPRFGTSVIFQKISKEHGEDQISVEIKRITGGWQLCSKEGGATDSISIACKGSIWKVRVIVMCLSRRQNVKFEEMKKKTLVSLSKQQCRLLQNYHSSICEAQVRALQFVVERVCGHFVDHFYAPYTFLLPLKL